jgi:hypothetical protein
VIGGDFMAIVQQGNRVGLYITDYKDLIRELNKVQPGLVKQMQKDFKEIAKPVQSAVKSNIPTNPPTSGIHKKRPQRTVSGFYPRVIPGRLTWGANSQNKGKSPRSVMIETPSVAKAARAMKRAGVNASSIARLRIDNAAVVMADMAGKSGKYIDKRSRTNEYKYSRSATGVRRHKINGQGKGMIRALGSKASRFVWPAAERAVPKTFAQSRRSLQKAYDEINRKMAA